MIETEHGKMLKITTIKIEPELHQDNKAENSKPVEWEAVTNEKRTSSPNDDT